MFVQLNIIPYNFSMQGLYGEMAFPLKCLEHGFSVSKPLDPSSPYDFILDNGKELLKIQVKCTATHKKNKQGLYEIELMKRSGNRYNKVKKAYSDNEVDFFAVYLLDINLWYIIPFQAAKGRANLAIRPSYDKSIHNVFKEAWFSLESTIKN